MSAAGVTMCKEPDVVEPLRLDRDLKNAIEKIAVGKPHPQDTVLVQELLERRAKEMMACVTAQLDAAKRR